MGGVVKLLRRYAVAMRSLCGRRPAPLHLFEATVQVELPPVEVVGVEGEVVVLAAVAGVRQHIAPTLGEAQEDVSGGRKRTTEEKHSRTFGTFSSRSLTHPARKNSSLTMVFSGTQTRGGSFRKRR